MEYILTGIICILFAYIVYVDRQRTNERKDLLNRIMAKDYREYVIEEGQVAPPRGRSKMANANGKIDQSKVDEYMRQFVKE